MIARPRPVAEVTSSSHLHCVDPEKGCQYLARDLLMSGPATSGAHTMASYLPFNSWTIDGVVPRHRAFSFEFDEFQTLSTALVQRLREGSMPPDDAYWWARSLCSEAYVKDEALEFTEQCRVA
jgi:hypothetical protein